MMSLMIRARGCGGKRPTFLVTTSFDLILCIFCPISLQAVGGAAHKTDAELAEAVIGNWEIPPSKNFLSFRKAFLTFNKDGTCKAIGITNDRGSPRRVEVEAKWRVNQGYLIAEAIKTTPANRGIRTRLDLRDQIESIEDGNAKLRDEKGGKAEMRRLGHLPSLPSLLTSETWVPELSPAEAKKIAISAPRPDYPVDARRRGWVGTGIFACHVRPDGTVSSVEVIVSKKHHCF